MGSCKLHGFDRTVTGFLRDYHHAYNANYTNNPIYPYCITGSDTDHRNSYNRGSG